MGLGGATKKLQKVADMGEELYSKMNELREQLLEVRETVGDTNRRVAALENKVDQQAALLEALAHEKGIDVDAVLTEVAIEEAEPTSDSETATDAVAADDAVADDAGRDADGADTSTEDDVSEGDDDAAIGEAESGSAADDDSDT